MENSSSSDMDQLLTIECDDIHIREQLDELLPYFKERIPDDFLSDLRKLPLDLVLTDVTTTLGADNIIRYVIRPRFGSRFESLIAAVRANDII